MRIRSTLFALVITLAVMGSALPAAAGDCPENGRITFGRFDPALDDYSIWAANPDGTHPKRLTHVPSFFSDWSPGGRRIAFDFVDGSGVHIATMDPNGRHMRQLTFGRGIQEVPKWSPDGRWITFNASPLFPGEPGFQTDIWIMRADGSHPRRLTRGAFDVEPVFSPDGHRVAFGRLAGFDAQGFLREAIHVVNTDGTRLRRVVPPTSGLEHPDWSPDGRWISFNIAPEAPNPAVMVVHPDGKGLRVLRHSNRFELFKPVWSPDGNKLLVGCFDVRAQIDKLCTMRANGHNLRVVVSTPDGVNFPAWGSHRPKH